MNIKKLTKKGADGSSIIYEFDVPKMDSIPNHPGKPKGPDTVPAWLTPGEFVVNAEATRMFEPQIEAMNDAGKAVQRQQGGTIPQYKADGGQIPPGYTDEDIALEEQLNSLPLIPERPSALVDQLGSTNPNLVPQEIDLTNAIDMSPLALISDELDSQEYNTPYNPRLNPNREVVPTQRDDRSMLETLFGPSGSILPLGYTDGEDAKSRIKSLKAQRDNAVKSGNLDIVRSLDSQIEEQESVVDSSNQFNQSVKTARSINDTRDLNDKIERVVYSTSNDTDKRTALSALGLEDEEINKVIKDTAAVSDITKSNEKEAIANSIVSVINNPDLTSETKDLTPKDAEDEGIKIVTKPEVPKSFLEKVSNFFTENFKDLIDDDKLMNAALMYAGSRALGYSHGGSLNFVGRNYLSDIQKKLAVADKASLSNKYTKDSVKKYRDTGKVEDLELAKNVQLVNSEILVNDKGEQVRVNKYEDKNTGKTVYQTEDGTSVNRSKFMTQAEANSASDRVVKGSSSIFKGNMDKIRNVDPDEAARLQALLPTDEAFGMALERVGVKYGLSPSLINSKAEVLSNNMIEHAAKTGHKLSADVVEGFLNKEFLTASLSDMGISSMLKGVDQDDIELLNSRISKEPIQLASEYKRYAKEYNDLKDKRKQYERKAPEGTTGFMIYIQEQLDAKNKQ